MMFGNKFTLPESKVEFHAAPRPATPQDLVETMREGAAVVAGEFATAWFLTGVAFFVAVGKPFAPVRISANDPEFTPPPAI